MSTEIIPIGRQPPCEPAGAGELPTIVLNAGGNARYAYAEFFGDEVENAHTRKVYRHAVDRFLRWCQENDYELHRIPPGSVGHYVRGLMTVAGKPASKPTQKLHLAAIRKFFDTLVVRHAVVINPAASVRGPKLKMTVGKTPAADPEQARRVLQAIHAGNVVGLRDCAIVATLIYTACRVGAVSKLQRKHFYTDGRQWYLHFDEKGGKDRHIPCRHDLQGYIEEYLVAAGGTPDDDSPLFRTAVRRTRRLTMLPMQAKDIHCMVKRRIKNAGLPKLLTCHSFRATTATDLLDQGVPIEDVQELLGHADLRTTRLYDRRDRRVTRNIVERISI